MTIPWAGKNWLSANRPAKTIILESIEATYCLSQHPFSNSQNYDLCRVGLQYLTGEPDRIGHNRFWLGKIASDGKDNRTLVVGMDINTWPIRLPAGHGRLDLMLDTVVAGKLHELDIIAPDSLSRANISIIDGPLHLYRRRQNYRYDLIWLRVDARQLVNDCGYFCDHYWQGLKKMLGHAGRLIVQVDHGPDSKPSEYLSRLTKAISGGFDRQAGALTIYDDDPEIKQHTEHMSFVIAFADDPPGSRETNIAGVKGQIQRVE